MKTIVLALTLCCAIKASAQNDWFYFPDEMYFVKEVPAKEFRGKHFKYQIAVNQNASDTFSKVRINGVGVGKHSDDFLNNSGFTKGYHTENNWTIYTISGTVPDEAYKLWFYAAVNGNGEFYFDDIEFFIEENGEWIEVELPNTSFEKNSKNIFEGYYVSSRTSPHLKTSLSNNVSYHGSQSLKVETFGLIPTSPRSITRH